MQPLVALVFANLQVAGGMKSHPIAAAPLCPDMQGDLLTHGAAGHKDSRLFAQQFSHFLLKAVDNLAFAIVIALQVRLIHLRQRLKRLRGLLWVMPEEETGA